MYQLPHNVFQTEDGLKVNSSACKLMLHIFISYHFGANRFMQMRLVHTIVLVFASNDYMYSGLCISVY